MWTISRQSRGLRGRVDYVDHVDHGFAVERLAWRAPGWRGPAGQSVDNVDMWTISLELTDPIYRTFWPRGLMTRRHGELYAHTVYVYFLSSNIQTHCPHSPQSPFPL